MASTTLQAANDSDQGAYCPAIWDELLCWPATEAGTERQLPCPEYYGFKSETYATKKCTENGTWYFNEQYNKTWTNYSECILLYDKETGKVDIPVHSENLTIYMWWVPKIKTLSHVGYGISLTTLITAIAIFCCFKKLQCARNCLHLHLFLSFSLKAFMTLLKDSLFVEGIALAEDLVLIDGKNTYVKEHNFWLCKAITSAWQYFIMTNYILILMEGIYLHYLLFRTVFSEKNDINLYAALGWGLPTCFIIPWIILKVIYEDELCWTKQENKYYLLVIHVPIVIATLINLILFVKIVHILLVKLNIMYVQHQRIKYRRLIRSTLILMPLFGVPYTLSIVTWYFATTDQVIELVWMFFDQTFTSLQGFFVALLYCLLNNEVQNELKKCVTFTRKTIMRAERIDRHNSFPMCPVSRCNVTVSLSVGQERRLTT
ncbi:Diuretic hormone 44 receptor 2 [Carabus blaptoides fortunei]